MKNSNLSIGYIFIFIICIAWALFMMFFSQDSLEAARDGIHLWYNAVLPALFPFFVCSRIMTRAGISKIVGKLFEPVMRPLFKVPGEASFIFTISITSGYPIGTQLVAGMREQRLISRSEAERMLSFCSTSGPLFMLGVVGAGMFSNPLLGWSIALSHFSGAILNGLLFRFHGKSELSRMKNRQKISDIVKEAEMGMQENNSFILYLGEAILDSFKTLLMICGYIVFFSIIISILEKFSFFYYVSNIGCTLFPSFNPLIISSCLKGFFEITLGCQAISEISNIEFIQTCILCSGIISWSGLSIHAQALTFIARTDIKGTYYIFTKAVHSLCSMVCASIITPILLKYEPRAFNVFHLSEKIINSNFSYKLLFSTKLMLIVIILFTISAIVSYLTSLGKKDSKLL